jgi:hypothetical protein
VAIATTTPRLTPTARSPLLAGATGPSSTQKANRDRTAFSSPRR